MSRHSFLFLAANTPWVYSLAESLSAHATVTAIRFFDWINYFRQRPRWPEETSSVRRRMVKLPPGYAGQLERLFRPYVHSLIHKEVTQLRLACGVEPFVVCPYPYLAPWIRKLSSESLVYYNLDDYTLYEPKRAARIASFESELVNRSRISVCLSVHQVSEIRSRHPFARGRVVHFPLGVVRSFLNFDTDVSPLPGTVGYVGNLTNRVDWNLFERVAELLPEVNFHIVGEVEDLETGAEAPGWRNVRARVMRRPNIIYEGGVPQSEVQAYFRRYAVNWMPYAMNHPFNIASCPTKIMDALASGRPFVATDLPEVSLHKDRIRIVRTALEAANELNCLFADGGAFYDKSQVEYAASQTWAHRAEEFLKLLNDS